MSSKPGTKAKDSAITDNLNNTRKSSPTSADIRAAKLERRRDDSEREKTERELLRLEAEVVKRKKRLGIVPGNGNGSEDTEEDAKSAYELLKDMRWVYQKTRGRHKLKELVSGDDKQFISIVKELMKIESALLAAKLRREEKDPGNGPAARSFFVVLKGLEDDKRIIDSVSQQKIGIDLGRVAHLVEANAEKYDGDIKKEKAMDTGGLQAPDKW